MVDLKIITSSFVNGLNQSLQGNKTSLAFIINEIPKTKLVKNGEKFQVMVVGGTIFKSAILLRKDNNLEIISVKEVPTPVLETKEIFLDFILSNLEEDINNLALNFAFPIVPIFEGNELDARLLYPTKEHNFKDLIGEKIGENIRADVLKKRNQKLSVSLANDTICLLLSGLTRFKSEDLAAGILGTGFNMAIFLDAEKSVNLEAGNFNKFDPSEEGAEIDRLSEKPGVNIFEKEISGGYLYQHFNLLVKKRKLNYALINSTKELNDLCLENIPQVSDLAREVMDYSASFFAANLAGILEFKKRDLNFVMQGSVFWKGNNYKEKVVEHLAKITSYKANFFHIDNSDIIGAAKLIA